jgi:hypothetical protein
MSSLRENPLETNYPKEETTDLDPFTIEVSRLEKSHFNFRI